MKICWNVEILVQRVLVNLLLCIDIASTNKSIVQTPYKDLQNTVSLTREAQRNDFYSIKSKLFDNRETSSGRRD